MFKVLLVFPALLRQDNYILVSISWYHAKTIFKRIVLHLWFFFLAKNRSHLDENSEKYDYELRNVTWQTIIIFMKSKQFIVNNLHFIMYFTHRGHSPDRQQPIKEPSLHYYPFLLFNVSSVNQDCNIYLVRVYWRYNRASVCLL